MPACPACGVAMTPDEWNTGSCFACRAPLLEPKRYYEPASAFDPTSPASVTLHDQHRPAWGTVRAGFTLQIVGVLLLWGGATGIAAMGLSDHALRRTPPAVVIMSTASLVFSAGAWFCLFAGYLMCAAVPSAERVRRWMWFSLSATIAAAVLFCFLHDMTGANELENDLQARREHYLRTLDVKAGEPQDTWKDSLWSDAAIKTTAYSVLGMMGIAFVTYVVFVWSLAGFLRRRTLSRVILGLCGTLAIVAVCLAALVTYESLAPADISRGLKESTGQQAVNAFLFIAMAALTVYAGCCWAIRNDLATLLRGDHLRP